MSEQTSTLQLLDDLEKAGAHLWEESGQLRFRAPKGVMTPERVVALRERKDTILDLLRSAGLPTVVADPANAHAPFPLTDVQTAYLLGRRRDYAYGGVACHLYLEVEYDELDPARLERAWNRLIARHDMLRAVIHDDGSQQVLPEVPHYRIPVANLRGESLDAVDARLAKVRDELGHQTLGTEEWPLFELCLTLAPDRAVLHVSLDFLLADWASVQILLDQLEQLHDDPDCPLPQTDVSFRDYVLAERGMRDSARYRLDRDYWYGRIDELPAAPELPTSSRDDGLPVFARKTLRLSPAAWLAFKRRAGEAGLTASGAVLAAYAEVIGMWARRPEFTLNLTLLNRLPLHPQVPALVGDFTSVTLLAVDPRGCATFVERAQRLGRQLFGDMDHRLFSGVEVIREIARRRSQADALMPVVFTSSIGIEGGGDAESAGRFGYGITQTPQVWIDCQALERNGELLLNWDYRTEVFPDGLIYDMFGAFEQLLEGLSDDPQVWRADSPVSLSTAQARRRTVVNSTAGPLPATLLYEPVLAAARRHPDRVAVVDTAGEHTYRELWSTAAAFAAALEKAGAAPGDIVAITLDKGLAQIAAVLGTLAAGAVYLPIDPGQPAARRDGILRDSGAGFVLSARADDSVPAPVLVLAADEIAPHPDAFDLPAPCREPDDLAYVIYTSGSTGTPKGVMISHRAAANTIADISERFGVGAEDRVLGLANLGFDLSVYDIFGALGAGGTLVLPDPVRRGEPAHWAELVARHGITVWNSVPAQLQMLSNYLSGHTGPELPSLRLALLSGDWIPVTLFDEIRGRIPDLRLISLGGATEAAIWSIHYPIESVAADAASIPYGYPLRNQTFHVYDHALRDRPDWVAGELYIGGAGLALGYLNDAERTGARFVRHPVTGERIYRTGDFGRYLPSGAIEFLGRDDFQVKIRGHRIEIAEVEAAVLSHPAVRAAVVLVDGDDALRRRLVAFIETDGGADDFGQQQLETHLRDLLPGYMCPAAVHALPSIPVTANGKVDRAALASRLRDLTATAADGGDEPVDDLERTLARLWAEVLKRDRVGRHDNFFALGGNSLLSTQLVAKLRERVPQAANMFFDTLVRELLPEPTVAAMARYLSGAARPARVEPARRQIVSPLVRLGKGTADPVVVLVHDGTGKFYNFADLPNLLDRSRKVLGLTAGDPDTYLRATPDQLLTRRVSAYARLLRTERPGAVRLVGYGATALLTVEVARELAAAGTRVEQVVLVNPYHVVDQARADVAVEYLFAREIGVAPEQVGYPATLAQAAARQYTTSQAERIAAVAAAVVIGADITVARRYDIFRTTIEALRGYRVRPYDGPVVILGTAPEPELAGLAEELRAGGVSDVTVRPSGGTGSAALAALLNGPAA
ncbi:MULTISPECIES: non-ribosomal peptide synthetase [unclassified Nocardia]|uniref:non-ribosomal peptide synthetase n=1 Tax=unclassified Nocardia TaxID=2637762 RepID=UPI001CE48772|nr:MULTISPECIES: non-ribosomal peptide synthetase [unclassified Nocardia]